jgi:hypothetical protein
MMTGRVTGRSWRLQQEFITPPVRYKYISRSDPESGPLLFARALTFKDCREPIDFKKLKF